MNRQYPIPSVPTNPKACAFKQNITYTPEVIFTGNTFKPWHPNKNAFPLESCQNVTIKNNKVKGELISTQIKLKKIEPTQLTLGKNSAFQH